MKTENTQTKTQATARPWRAVEGKRNWMVEADSATTAPRSGRVYVAEVYETSITLDEPDHAKADAALIVQAVNEYDALCSVAEAAWRETKKINNHYYRPTNQEEWTPLESALAALAALRKEGGM